MNQNNILDLVISDDYSLIVSKCSFPLVPIDFAHPPLQIIGFNDNAICKIKSLPPVFYFIRTNYEDMNIYFNSINWGSLLSNNLDFSLVISNIYSTIYKGISIFSPKFTNHNHKYLQWYSRELKSLVFNKKRLHKEFKMIAMHIMNFLDYVVYVRSNQKNVECVVYDILKI